MLVTTAYRPDGEAVAYARSIADRLGARYVPRNRETLPRLRKAYGVGDIVVAHDRLLRYYAEGGDDRHPLFFHPGMAAIRIKRLLNGEPDTLLDACGLAPGDAVLDCTAGMAADAIVFAYGTGPGGEVTALESEPLAALITGEGLASAPSDLSELREAMRRVTLVCADHLDYLRRQPPERYDIVYFDPMFRRPVKESVSLNPLRRVANPDKLRAEAIHEAMRVARKCVVLKERGGSGEFARLGFTPVHRPGANTGYGVIRK